MDINREESVFPMPGVVSYYSIYYQDFYFMIANKFLAAASYLHFAE